jgi:hypothetical protein
MIKAANASRHVGRGGADEDDEDDGPTRSSVDEVEMGLLAHDEHASSSPTLRFASVDCEGYVESEEEHEEHAVGVRDGYGDGYGDGEAAAAVPLTREDKKAMALLIILCASSSSLAFHLIPSASTVLSCRR